MKLLKLVYRYICYPKLHYKNIIFFLRFILFAEILPSKSRAFHLMIQEQSITIGALFSYIISKYDGSFHKIMTLRYSSLPNY